MKTLPLLTALLLLSPFNQAFAEYNEIHYDSCLLKKESYDQVMKEVEKGNHKALASLAGCLRFNHKLVFQACLKDPAQLQGANEIFRDNNNFVERLMKVHPQILQYASDRLRSDQIFIKKASFIYRDALQYSLPKLRDNILFMRQMIESDSRNYIFASNRIKNSIEHATLAFKDNGSLMMYAPDEIQSNKYLAKIAVKSNPKAFYFIDAKLKTDKEIIKIFKQKNRNFSKKTLEEFLRKNYVKIDERENVGDLIDKTKNLHEKNLLIKRNYITKWQRDLYFKGYHLREKWNMTEAYDRNFPSPWQEDLKEHPKLVEKLERFFANRFLDKETIDHLTLTGLWQVDDKPLTLAFNLYLLRPSNDIELGDEFVSLTLLTAIATKSASGWRLSVIDVIFDNEIKANIIYEHGHKKYILQDLYFANDKDRDPKVIYRVEDKLHEYFEIYQRSSGDKFRLVYRLDPLEIKSYDDELRDENGRMKSREEIEEIEWRKMMEKKK